VTFGAARAGVVVRQHLDHLPKAENDTLTEAIGSVIAGLAAFLVLNGLADRASWLWPRRHIQSAFQRSFSHRWRSGTAATDAVFDSNVLGTKPVIRGWSFNARRHRAKVIAAALAGNGTAPFVPVTGPEPAKASAPIPAPPPKTPQP
jgi:hypothetical protein